MLEKINQSHYSLIKELLENKLEQAQVQLKTLPVIGEIEPYLKHIIKQDGYILTRGGKSSFVSFTYIGTLFYGRKGIYTAEWAHYLSDDLFLNYELLGAVYEYMKLNNLKDHSISLFEHRSDLIPFMFDLSYGGRCIDAHVKPRSGVETSGIRLAILEDRKTLIRLLKEHHDHMVNAPVCIGMSYDGEEETIDEWIKNKCIHVKVVKEEVVGFMKLSRGTSGGCDLASNETTLGIETTQIDKNHQHKGYGEALLDYAHRVAVKENYDTLAVDYEPFNYGAHRFWSKHFDVTIRSLIRSIG